MRSKGRKPKIYNSQRIIPHVQANAFCFSIRTPQSTIRNYTEGLGYNPAALTIPSMALSHSIAWICTPFTPGVSNAW